MSDTKETDTNNSGGRKPLSPARKSAGGTVRQSFSHGRTKNVVVETKKKRVVTPGSGPKPASTAGAKANGGAKTAESAQNKLAAAAKKLGITEAELRARQEVLRKRRELEKAREADQQKQTAARERLKEEQERQFREKREREEAEARKKAAEEEEKRLAAEEAQRQANREKPSGRKAAGRAAPAAIDPADVPPQPDDALGALGGRLKKSKERPENESRVPASKPRVEPRQRRKLTINSVLDDVDGGRQRSLASVKRAREKERERRQGGSGGDERSSREVKLPETITVQELANRMKERVAAVVKFMFQQGEPVRANDIIDADTAELIIEEFGHTTRRVSDADVEIGLEGEDDDPKELVGRPPVVTIMGHVDHGKTSLLDALRATDVVSGEAGGITQHIGAYQVQVKSGQKISFLDTPGHAAFSAMRSRGANVTDIVILVVAADDGVMPQTIEAISHAKAAGVPMIVAVNKIDKPDAEPQKVLTELLQHDIQVEAMGGEVQAVEVSALKKKGLDELTEAITLQAELLELKANPKRAADGVVIESQLDKGRGAVATVLVQRGTLTRGDIVVAGSQWGKVRALVNERGKQLKEAGPALPVEVLGLDGAPDPGDVFVVVDTEARAREITEYRDRLKREKSGASPNARASLEQLLSRLKDGTAETQELPVVVKGDVQGSVEAISQSLDKISTDEVRARVIHGAVGGISESDVLLAQSSGAPIFAFNVRANKQARELAEKEGVEIRYYSIIYELLDDVKDTLSGMLAPEKRETFIGYAEILEVFNISKVGKVAGCRITEGTVKRGCGVRLLRDDVVIHEGMLKTLKRFKDEVPEVTSGMECGMAFEKYDDMRVGDRIECFTVEEIQRSLD